MKTKLVLPLVALAMLATALPASAQEQTEVGTESLIDEPTQTFRGYEWVVVPNPRGGWFLVSDGIVLVVPQPEPEVQASDSQRRGPERL
jgi:hypothetical protein